MSIVRNEKFKCGFLILCLNKYMRDVKFEFNGVFMKIREYQNYHLLPFAMIYKISMME